MASHVKKCLRDRFRSHTVAMSATSVIKLSGIRKSFGHILFVEYPGLEAREQEIEDLDSKYSEVVQENQTFGATTTSQLLDRTTRRQTYTHKSSSLARRRFIFIAN